MSIAKEGDLRVWYIHQVGGSSAFHKPVASAEEAKTVLATIYELTTHLYDSKCVPDYANAGGLEVYESDGEGGLEWCEWYDDDGLDISEIMSE